MNISGTFFECDSLIFQRFPDTVLARMFADENSTLVASKEEKDGYFFDRDADIFKGILTWYRTGLWPSQLFSETFVDRAILYHELKAWGIVLDSMSVLSERNLYDDDKDELDAETRAFFKELMQSSEFRTCIKFDTHHYTLYFQNIDKSHLEFRDYYDPQTDQWKRFTRKENKSMSVAEKCQKYWKNWGSLAYLLKDIYADIHAEHDKRKDGYSCLACYSILNPEYVAEAIQQGQRTKCAFRLTELIYQRNLWSETQRENKLQRLQKQVLQLLNQHGYCGEWKQRKTTCGFLNETNQWNCNMQNFMSDFPFETSEARDGDCDLREYPLHWCQKCEKQAITTVHSHPPIQIEVISLEIWC